MNPLLAEALARLPDEAACRAVAQAQTVGEVEEGATWPYLWPGGLRLAADLAALLPPPTGRLLDLGCGRGLLGMQAWLLGWRRITFADGDPAALGMLQDCLKDMPEADCQLLEWDKALVGPSYDVILGGDILYRPEYHASLLACIASQLSNQGQALLADPRSQIEANLGQLACRNGLDLSIEQRPGPYTLCRLQLIAGKELRGAP